MPGAAGDSRSEEISSRSLRSRVNPGNTDERKEAEVAAGNSWRFASRSEVGYFQASRQENAPMAAGNSWREEQHQTHRDARRLVLSASTPELRNMEYTNHRYMSKIFQLGMSATNATFSMQAYKTNELMWRMFMTSSMKAAIHLGPNYVSNSEVYKIRGY